MNCFLDKTRPCDETCLAFLDPGCRVVRDLATIALAADKLAYPKNYGVYPKSAPPPEVKT